MNEFRNYGQILNYIKKHYYVKDGVFFNRCYEHEYGNDIIRELPKIFSVDREICIEIFKKWGESQGVDYFDVNAYVPNKLNVSWSPDLAQDINHYAIDAEAELISSLTEELAREIHAEILIDLKGQLNPNEFLDVIKCVGYEKGPTVYDPTTFMPRNYFISMKKHEIEHERQNNSHWQNWIRSRR